MSLIFAHKSPREVEKQMREIVVLFFTRLKTPLDVSDGRRSRDMFSERSSRARLHWLYLKKKLKSFRVLNQSEAFRGNTTNARQI